MKISVLITTYNGERYLAQQLDSILAQSLQPAEVIVCDDRSSDGTVAILERYKQQGLLSYVLNEQRLGLMDNFKKAVSLAAKTNYIALSDQDDIWVKDKLEKSAYLLSQIEDKTKPCMVYTDLLLMNEKEVILNKSFRNELGQDAYRHNLQTLLFGNFVNGCTVLMNQELGGFFAAMPNDIRLNHDGWIGLAAFTFGNAAEIKEPLVRYRKHDRNVSIAADTRPRNRYRSNLKQILSAISGKDDFLAAQLETVRRFYDCYNAVMTTEKRIYFEQFLKLEHQPYLFKKLAFRKVVRRFSL